MAVKIRLSRQGGKKNPLYLIVAVDSAKKRDGVFLEKLGSYSPKEKVSKNKVKIDAAKVQAWVDRGALMTQTVGQLVKIATK